MIDGQVHLVSLRAMQINFWCQIIVLGLRSLSKHIEMYTPHIVTSENLLLFLSSPVVGRSRRIKGRKRRVNLKMLKRMLETIQRRLKKGRKRMVFLLEYNRRQDMRGVVFHMEPLTLTPTPSSRYREIKFQMEPTKRIFLATLR